MLPCPGFHHLRVELAQRALDRGLSLSEWGLVPAAGEGTAKEKAEKGGSVKAKSEAELFAALGLKLVLTP